jgi:hypothetical protein
MSRVVLIHWNAAEGKARELELRALGYDALAWVPAGGSGLRAFRENPPDAFVIDLTRVPSQGCAVGVALRQYKSTRGVRLVFAGGEPEKVKRTRGLLPDAIYTGWEDVGRAVAGTPMPAPGPVVPDTMAGYSGTPLPKKLGIRAGVTVALLGAPEGFARTLGELPEGVRLATRGKATVILLFVRSAAGMRKRFASAARNLERGGALWIVWPKKASGVASDLSQAVVRRFGLDSGFVDYKICAVDATWSGLCFARRGAG